MDLIIDNKTILLLNPEEDGLFVLKSNNSLISNNSLSINLSKAIDLLGTLSAKVN